MLWNLMWILRQDIVILEWRYNDMRKMLDCCLCAQIQGNRENDLISKLIGEVKYTRRIPIENKKFVILPSLGALTAGHVLLCPKEHIKSLSALTPKYYDYFLKTKAGITAKLESLFGRPVHCFEHGSAHNSERVICTVDHAHLHLIPASVAPNELLDAELGWTEIQLLSKDFSHTVGNREYLYYETPEGKGYLATKPDGGFESQYMRKIFSKVLGKPNDWNWRDSPCAEQADMLYQELLNT